MKWITAKADQVAEPEMLLNWKKLNKGQTIQFEDNMVNRIVTHLVPQHTVDNRIVFDEPLYDYQVQDIEKMVRLGNVLNFNRMGYGKTVEAIIAAKKLNAQRVLVVAPKAVCMQWVAQIEQWWRVDVLLKDFEAPVVVINYEQLRSTAVLYKVKSIRWDVCIVDEAHYIKNPKSGRTQAVLSIPAKHRFALTGTPVLKSPEDLWSILEFVDPVYSGGSFWGFQFYFCEMVKTPFGWKNKGLTRNPKKVEVLRKLLDLAGVHNEDLKLTEGKRVSRVSLEMVPEQKRLHKQVTQLLIDELPEECTVANGLSKTTRLQQITSWPGKFIEGCEGPRFQWILEQCLGNPNEKLVVLTRYAQTAAALSEFLQNHKVYNALYLGQWSSVKRQQSLKKFQEDESTQVMIGTIGAMGTGVDGLQRVSHICVMLDRDWLPEINQQCEDRLNRVGQKEMVQVYYLECLKSYDTRLRNVNDIRDKDIRKVLKSDD